MVSSTTDARTSRVERSSSKLECLVLGAAGGALLGAVAGLTATGPMFRHFGVIALMYGTVLGLGLSPMLMREHDRRTLYRRFGLSLILGLLVAAPAGAVFGVGACAPVGVAVVGSFIASRGLGQGDARRALLASLVWPAVCLLLTGGAAYVWRLPQDEAQLIELLGDDSWERRSEATDRLIEQSGSKALVQALQHADAAVRESAARSLCQFAPDEVSAPLLRATQDENRRVRIAALGSLFHVGIEQPLIEALEDPDPVVRSRLVTRVSTCGDASHVPALESLLDDPDDRVRENVERTLAHLRDPARGQPDAAAADEH